MLRVTLRNLAARKVRLLLSAAAIILGVAFVAGTLVFTDTMGRSFDGIVNGTTPDVVVRPDSSGGWENASSPVDSRTIPGDLVHRLADVPGVVRADGNVNGLTLFLVGKDGKVIGGTGAPTISGNYNDGPAITGKPVLVMEEGRTPTHAGEVAIDPVSAEKGGYHLGDTVSMITAGEKPRITATLVGLVQFNGGSLAGASLVFFDTQTAQDLFLNGKDAYNMIALTIEPGVSQATVADRVRPLLPDGIEVVPGNKVAQESLDSIGKALDFINIFLLVFAGIALVVGTFLIINTFSILVAQRSRELALLRALGASRRQVTRSVLLEAALVGVVGSTLGLLLGWGLAAGLKLLFGSLGLDMSGTPLVFGWRTTLVAYAVGVLITMIAAYLPARRASRIPPVAAMSDDVALPESSIRHRVMFGAALTLLGVVAIVVGMQQSGGRAASLIGVGALAILLGVALMSPLLGRPVLSGLGVAYRKMFGTVGVLATQNALRNPRRTAATASALMIGLTLVTMMTIVGASVNASIDQGVKKQFTTDFMLSNPLASGFSPTIAQEAADLPEIGDVVEMQSIPTRVDNDTRFVTLADVALVARIYDLTANAGSMALKDGQIAIAQDVADADHVKIGDQLTLQFPSGEQAMTVGAIYAKSDVVSGLLAPFSLATDLSLPRYDTAVGINAAPGTSVAQAGDALRNLVKDVPTVAVQTQSEFAAAQRANVNQLLFLIYALLGLAIVIAILGIINTLALSIIERTREVGLLRAVGLTRPQLRRMVRLEAIAIAVLGAILGVAMGVAFGVALQHAVAEQGVDVLAVPFGRLAIFILVAGLVGILAAVVPARRAARLDVLRAITTE